jgi:hypothetical protein
MPRRRQAAPPLSVHRAFVVHLGPGTGRRRRFHGRVEHLSSGRAAAFSSLAGLLEFFAAIYPDQIVDGTTERVSLSPWNTEGFGSLGSFKPALSADGRFVDFQSFADNFGGTTQPAIFVRDRLLGTTEQVNETACNPASTPAVSADGRFIAYPATSTTGRRRRRSSSPTGWPQRTSGSTSRRRASPAHATAPASAAATDRR